MSFYNFAKYNFLSNFLVSEVFLSRLNHRQVKLFPLLVRDLEPAGGASRRLCVVLLIVTRTTQPSEPRFCGGEGQQRLREATVRLKDAMEDVLQGADGSKWVGCYIWLVTSAEESPIKPSSTVLTSASSSVLLSKYSTPNILQRF